MHQEAQEAARLLKAGNREYFPILMDIYRTRVYAKAFFITNSKEDAEDIAQETFLQMLNKIDQWQGGNFEVWLLKIAQNLSIDFLRKRKSGVTTEEILPEREKTSPEETLLRQEKIENIHKILQRLPSVQKEILYLKHFSGLSIREIAIKRNCSEGTVKATLFQILQKLAEQFENAGLME